MSVWELVGLRRADGGNPRRTLVVTPATTPRHVKAAMYAVAALVAVAVVVALRVLL